MKTKKQQVIDAWEKTIVVHPSYRSIADKVGVEVSYAFRVIKDYKTKIKRKDKNDNRLK